MVWRFVKSRLRYPRPAFEIRPPWTDFYDPGVPESITPGRETLYDLFSDTAHRYASAPFFSFLGREWSYGKVEQLSAHLANGLSQTGIRAGDRVALMLPNIPQFMIAYWAILRLRAIAVLINPLLSERELTSQLSQSASRCVFLLDRFSNRYLRIQRQVPVETAVVCAVETYMPPVLRLGYQMKSRFSTPSDRRNGSSRLLSFSALLADRGIAPGRTVDPSTAAVLLFSGGVTGTPKAIPLSHTNLIANAMQARAWIRDFADYPRTILAALPLIHSYGLSACHHLAVLTGAKLFLEPRFDAIRLIRLIRKHPIGLLPGVPTMFKALSEALKRKSKMELPLGACISGGGPLSAAIKRDFEQASGCRLAEGYGLSEASPISHCNPLQGRHKINSIGLPWPGTRARIVDMSSRQVVPAGQIGELEIKGPQVMSGYWEDPEESRIVLSPEGWLRTGDVAKMDKDGYFYIVDRCKDIIFSGGYNIYPGEIERVLMTHPAVDDVAVLGLPDSYYGERVTAMVVFNPDADISENELILYCRSRLARFKLPKQIVSRAELPKNMLGKPLKRQIKQEMMSRAIEDKGMDPTY
jgi:long-chain acyl-CoA synthetase